MLRSKVKKNTGLAGVANVRVLKNSLSIHFTETDETVDALLDGWDRESGVYNIVLEKTNDKVKFVSPPGPKTYLVRFLEFGNRPNGIPEPKKDLGGPRQSQHGGTYWKPDGWVASAKLEVIEDGLYKGLVIPHKVPYVFVQDPISGFTMLEGTAGENRKVEEFLRITGFDLANEDIPFQTNILPWLEARLQSAGKLFQVKLNERGFVDSLEPLPAFIDVSSLLGKNGKTNGKKAPAKTKAKKAK